MPSYDAVVIGAGVFGSWIAYQLRLSGRSVALLDALGPANSRASSGGESRIIRMSYGPEDIYTAWSYRSLSRWIELFAEIREPQLFQPTGVLVTTHQDDARLQQSRSALEAVGVPYTLLDQSRYPQIRFPKGVTGIIETTSGVLLARRAVQALVQHAADLGVAVFHAIADLPGLPGRCDSIRFGAHDTISAGQFIYACGPWLPKAFPKLLGSVMHVTRQEVFFFGPPPADTRFKGSEMPVWLDHSHPQGAYTVPDIESRGLKVAFDIHGPETDPDSMDRRVSGQGLGAARRFLQERMPDLASAPIVESRVCQYENSSNSDFLIDRHPDYDNVWLAGGGSGHGFKHGPAVGAYVEGLLSGTVTPEPRFRLAAQPGGRVRAIY